MRIWDLGTRRDPVVLGGHESYVLALAVDPSGRRLATAAMDGSVRIWDAGSGRELGVLRDDGTSITHLVFSPDGRTLATTGQDGAIRLWGSRPVAGDALSEREALGLVRFHAGRATSLEDPRARLHRDATAPAAARDRAQPLAGPFWEAEVRRRAEAAVTPLFQRPLLRDEVRAALRADYGLSAEVRAAALELASQWAEPAGAIWNYSWEVISPGPMAGEVSPFVARNAAPAGADRVKVGSTNLTDHFGLLSLSSRRQELDSAR